MAQYVMDLFGSCLSCFPGTSPLKINRYSLKVSRLLGEGGFSYVYLVQDINTEALYALKKIRCSFGQESVSLALKEVEAYKLFAPFPNIIQCIDYSISSDRSDPGVKTVYILLPYYRRGNLQDIINANLVNHTNFPEKELMVLFLGVCRALKAMHNFGERDGQKENNENKKINKHNNSSDLSVNQELNSKNEQKDEAHEAKDNASDSEQQNLLSEESLALDHEENLPGKVEAYAHRDIKPGNIMIDDDGEQPILMDLGSIAPSPIAITSRSIALAVQDTAAEHSTMPYRAPELFDVKTGCNIDTKVDIWSLGCTLYACLVGKSPFEMRSDETGGSLSICVLSGDWRFPDEGTGDKNAKNKAAMEPRSEINESIRDVVRKCLKVEPTERPDVNELITMTEDIIAMCS
ncbi:Serine/threonine-protein kinase ENV7 [Erysiphe neolycopersici]|uniref:non-specific serine/threonine protein kinase n=1 Tax=Erysiphe neolycopersici TaxID=212602 RepID=A0A420HI84_9PEZI|nr:Serine/threonine-protein kinase ENV7 [Erysiphe neolycopersici]RKF65019.1 Serine/threonine-protein kinase ENV7 [Erysiphe neolycopersici]